MRKASLTILMVVITCLVLVVTLILTALKTMDYLDQRATLTEQLAFDAKQIANRLGQNLVTPIYEFKDSQAVEIIDSEMANKNVFAITVVEPDGNVFAARIRDEGWQITALKAEGAAVLEGHEHADLVESHDVVRDEENLGAATVYVTEKFLQDKLHDLLVKTVVQVLAADVLLVVILLFLLRAVVIGPLKNLQRYAANVGGGDLTCAAPQGRFIGELADLKNTLQGMVCNLQETIDAVQRKEQEALDLAREAEAAKETAEAAREEAVNSRREGMQQAAERLTDIAQRIGQASGALVGDIDNVSQASDSQKERITMTATAIEEMNATILSVADNAAQTSNKGEEAGRQAESGNAIMVKTVDSINNVERVAEGLKESMNALEQKADGIGQIITTIQDIADQTNLLALNAAIEAARAGEAGRGFAVVADEVRKLAEKTMTATKEVESAIRAIQSDTKESLAVTETVTGSVHDASALAQEAGEALGRIVGIIAETSDQISQIAAATEEQSASMEEINRTVDDVNEMAVSIADNTAQSSRAVADLDSLADEMQSLIEELKRG